MTSHASFAPDDSRVPHAAATASDAQRDESALADGFACHVEGWARATGADAHDAKSAAQAARALSLAASQGHVCLELAQLGGASATWRAHLMRAGVTGTPASPGACPLILDDADRLYLHRDFDLERRLARRIARAGAATVPDAADTARRRGLLDAVFGAAPADPEADWQKVAVGLALRQRLAVVSGGPGTGKTTLLVQLLACLLADDADCRIALAAPTGKAAARLLQALQQRAAGLPAALRERLPTEASTVHRLLRPGADGRFRHGAAHPLAIDALVVDEASMLDLALATRLLEAVPEHARIVLVGDKDQLSAVEAGAVFAELSADPSLSAAGRADLAESTRTPLAALNPPAPARSGMLRDTAVWLVRNYRFAADSGIGRLAALVHRGQAQDTLDWLAAQPDAGVRWWPETGPRPEAETVRCLERGYGPYLDAVRADPADRARIAQAHGAFRVLCAQREGPRGVAGINALVNRWARAHVPAAQGHDEGSPWYVGRPVMVLDNDYVLRLFNGDIGIALPDARGQLLVHFPDAAAPGGFRAVPPLRLPRHDTAWAMTVHKAQGSEFDDVLVLLPREPSRVCTRELLYTAVTRARRHVSVVATAPVLAATIGTSTRRHSGLADRLAEAIDLRHGHRGGSGNEEA